MFGAVYAIAVATWIVGLWVVALGSRRRLRRRAGVTPFDLPISRAVEGGVCVFLWPCMLTRLRRWHHDVEQEYGGPVESP